MNDNDAIIKTIMDYVEGWYSGDAERMKRALSIHLAKRKVTAENQLVAISRAWIVKQTGRRRGCIPNPEEGLWSYNVTALDVPYNEYPFSLVAGITKYQGDFNSDGDVDGSDLVELVGSVGLSTEIFAENYGKAIQE